jgi:hypothetical protein
LKKSKGRIPGTTEVRGGIIGSSFLKIIGSHPETPSPLAGEGWGEGEQNGTPRDPEPISPPPFPPPSRGRRKRGYSGFSVVNFF